MNVFHSNVPGYVEVYEFTAEKKKNSDARVVYVPDDAIGLSIGVGRIEGTIFHRAENVRVLVTQNGKNISSEGAITEINQGNVRAYLSSQPPQGKWMVRVIQETAEPFMVSVAVFRKPIQWLKHLPPGARCRACKAAAKALIWALLAKLTGGAIAAMDLNEFVKYLLELANDILEALAHIIGMSADWLKELFGQIGEVIGFETPWGFLARLICEKLGLCPRGEAQD